MAGRAFRRQVEKDKLQQCKRARDRRKLSASPGARVKTFSLGGVAEDESPNQIRYTLFVQFACEKCLNRVQRNAMKAGEWTGVSSGTRGVHDAPAQDGEKIHG